MNKKYLERRKKIVNQELDLLLCNPNFQNDIKNIRHTYNIPQDGFNNNSESSSWQTSLNNSSDLYADRIEKYEFPKVIDLTEAGKLKEADALQKKLNDEDPLNAFHALIDSVVIKHKLPLGWKGGIHNYVLHNNKEYMHLSDICISVRKDKLGQKVLSIEISGNTTLEDVKQIWSEVKYHQKKLNSHTKNKVQPLRKLERDKRAYELKKEGYKLTEIAEILSKEFDDCYTYSEVGKYIERYSKKVDIN